MIQNTSPKDVQNTQNCDMDVPQIKMCPVCINSDKSDAHFCAICKVPVHTLEKCSVSYDEEGYEQKRICFSCSESSQSILASHEIEDWRGLNSKQNKNHTARYLGNNKCNINDSLTWYKSTKLPIIKNDNSMGLQAIKLEDKNYTLINTCAFDSLLQILLTAISDHKHFKTKI